MLKHGDCVTPKYKNRIHQGRVDVEMVTDLVITECAIKSWELLLEAWQVITKRNSVDDNTSTCELEQHQLDTSTPCCLKLCSKNIQIHRGLGGTTPSHHFTGGLTNAIGSGVTSFVSSHRVEKASRTQVASINISVVVLACTY